MARRGANRRAKATEPAIIAQANPTPEQRGRFGYAVAATVDPFGETVVQGKVKAHPVCVKVPVYKRISRHGFCDDAIKVLDWYAGRHAVAVKGLTVDSLAKADCRGGGSRVIPIVEARIQARDDIEDAKGYITDTLCLMVFEAVMEQERTFTELGGGNNDHEAVMVRAFKLAANHILRGIGSLVLEPR